MAVPNGFAIYADAGLGSDSKSRRSLTSIITTLAGVAIDWQAGLQGPIAISSTDSEIRCTFEASKRADYFFDL